MLDSQTNVDIQDLGSTLLDVGTILMSAGANTSRIKITMERIAGSFGYQCNMHITTGALMLTIIDEDEHYYFNMLKRTPEGGINFTVVSAMSRMSWKVVDEKWTIEQIQDKLTHINELFKYPRPVLNLLVALAGASFCRLNGGGYFDMAIVFVAAGIGITVRQELTKLKFNSNVCIAVAAFTAAMISGFAVHVLGWGDAEQHAFSTSVLYLVPGVPLINSFSDFIDGHLQNGLVRGLNGLIIAFDIAVGLLGAMLIYNVS